MVRAHEQKAVAGAAEGAREDGGAGSQESGSEHSEPDSDPEDDPARAAAQLRDEKAGPVEMLREELPSASLDGDGVGAGGDDWSRVGPEQRLSSAGPAEAAVDLVPGQSRCPNVGATDGQEARVNPEGYEWPSAVSLAEVDR